MSTQSALQTKARQRYSPLLLILAAAIIWSTGGLFIKWTSLSGLALSFGRSFFAAITVALFTRREGFRLNRVTALASLLYAALLVLFVRRDILIVIACLLGMSLFFVGKLRPQDVSGNILALTSGLCFAFYFLLLRHSSSREVNRASSVIYGNLLVVLATAPAGMAALPHLTRHDGLSVLYLGVVQIGFAYSLFTLGMAQGIRSLDASIIGYIEPVLNPIWVFLVLEERPSLWAICGGAIIITAVLVHTITKMKESRRVVRASPTH